MSDCDVTAMETYMAQPEPSPDCLCGDTATHNGPEGPCCVECMHKAVEDGRANYEEFDEI